MRGAGADDHDVGVVKVAAVVDDGGACHVTRLGACPELVAAGGRQDRTHRRQRLTGLDRTVAGTVQGGKELAAQCRIDATCVGWLEEPEPAAVGVDSQAHFLGDRHLGRGAQKGEGSAGAEAHGRHLGADFLPEFARAQAGIEFTRGPAGHPHQAEVAHRRTARLRLAFELDHIVATTHGVPGVGGAQDAAADDRDPHAR